MTAIDDFLKKKSDRAEKWLGVINSMMNDPAYDYASDTLDGIYDYICDNSNITDAQIQAVENIQSKPSHYGRR